MTNVENKKEEMFRFLDNIRKAGLVNMMGAAPYLINEFSLERKEARNLLMDWMKEKR